MYNGERATNGITMNEAKTMKKKKKQNYSIDFELVGPNDMVAHFWMNNGINVVIIKSLQSTIEIEFVTDDDEYTTA